MIFRIKSQLKVARKALVYLPFSVFQHHHCAWASLGCRLLVPHKDCTPGSFALLPAIDPAHIDPPTSLEPLEGRALCALVSLGQHSMWAPWVFVTCSLAWACCHCCRAATCSLEHSDVFIPLITQVFKTFRKERIEKHIVECKMPEQLNDIDKILTKPKIVPLNLDSFLLSEGHETKFRMVKCMFL